LRINLFLASVTLLSGVSTILAQSPTPDFAGPGVLSGGVGDAGRRSGSTADIRFYAGTNGVYDNGLTPFITDAQGNLIREGALWGVEAHAGAFGVHRWKQAQLGIDYNGVYRHYTNNSFYDGIDQALNVGLSYQHSRRLTFNFQEAAGTYGRTLSYHTASEADSLGLTAPGQIFDTRTSYVRSSAEAVILQSARTFYTAGFVGYLSNRRAKELADTRGYNVYGSVARRLTQYQSAGASYSFGQQDIPQYLTDVLIHTMEGTYDLQWGPRWSLSAHAGVSVSQINSASSITLDPILAAIFGTSRLTLNTYQRNIFPAGGLTVTRQFKQASLHMNYSRGITSGNGLVSVSMNENGSAGLSYTGIRKWNFGMDGGYYSVKDLVKSIGWSSTFSGGIGATYNLPHALHLNFRYDARHISLDSVTSVPTISSRVTFGLFFSPGEFPLSLW
jgi:hypothetical protein